MRPNTCPALGVHHSSVSEQFRWLHSSVCLPCASQHVRAESHVTPSVVCRPCHAFVKALSAYFRLKLAHTSPRARTVVTRWLSRYASIRITEIETSTAALELGRHSVLRHESAFVAQSNRLFVNMRLAATGLLCGIGRSHVQMFELSAAAVPLCIARSWEPSHALCGTPSLALCELMCTILTSAVRTYE
jgi:hypothetical protein